jgi:hypothetical protein
MKKHNVSETGSVSVLRWGKTIQWLRLALSKGPNWVGVFPHLRTETDPVSETLCFFIVIWEKSGRWTKSENPISLCVIHHRQNPIVSIVLYFCYFVSTTPVLPNTYNHSAWTPRKTPSSIVKNACLLVRYLAMDVLLLRARVAGMCLPTRCLAIGIHVNIYTYL